MIGAAALVVLLVFAVFLSMVFRVVVPTNEVHTVQNGKETVSYGKDYDNGNVYYAWSSWIPVIGVQVSVLPVSVFQIELDGYEAYDQGRLPFEIDVVAFFRITNANQAAQRVSSFKELSDQLTSVLQGSTRAILASNDIEEIMQGRGKFGDQFTDEVKEQLANWGVETVKNIELMDIRDSQGSKVIANIMAKKKSHIEMESRLEVAKNTKLAETGEIEARRETDLRKQEASQQVGLRTVETEREVSLAQQAQAQAVKEQEKLTKEKEMNVKAVEHVRTAEINSQVQLVKADQDKKTAVIKAEAQKETLILESEGKLEAERRNAEATVLNGEAQAGAEKALLLAPVEAQTTLAKEIGANTAYQSYLLQIRQIEASQAIGVKQAEALNSADIKMIVNTGDGTLRRVSLRLWTCSHLKVEQKSELCLRG